MAKREAAIMTLEQHRRRRLWTLRDLAEEAGVTQQTIVSIKRGSTPRVKTIRKICGALGVEPWQVAEFAKAIGGGDG